MASKNDVTGDSLVSKPTNKAYADGWDRIFGKKDKLEKKLKKEKKDVKKENIL